MRTRPRTESQYVYNYRTNCFLDDQNKNGGVTKQLLEASTRCTIDLDYYETPWPLTMMDYYASIVNESVFNDNQLIGRNDMTLIAHEPKQL